MAELTREEITLLLEAFLPAYNAKRMTQFCARHLLDEPDNQSCDLHLLNPRDGELKLQVTTLPGDSSDRESLKVAAHFHHDLVAALIELGVTNAVITLRYTSIPRDRKQKRDIIASIAREARSKWEIAGSLGPACSSGDALHLGGDLDCSYSVGVEQSESLNALAKPVILMVPSLGTLVNKPAAQLKEAYEKKLAKYVNSAKDLALVVHFDVNAYDPEEVEDLVSALSPYSDDFREVWALCDLRSAHPRVDCIRP